MNNQFLQDLLQIPIPEEFSVYDDYDELTCVSDDYVNEVYKLADKYNLSLITNYGVSQLCFIIEGNENEVIKIGFEGSTCYVCDDDEITDESEYYGIFEPFDCNYSLKTETIFEKAKDAGVSEFFADIYEIGYTPNHKPIFLQKYVKPYSYFTDVEKARKTSPKSISRAKELDEEYIKKSNRIPFRDDWVAAALEQYGEDKFKDLMAFIKNNYLSDFHTDNYGYTKDGKVCLLDYCGFGSW